MSQLNQVQIAEYLSILDSIFGKLPEGRRDTALGPDGPSYTVDQSDSSFQHPDSLPFSFISRALVRHNVGDIAAVALPYDDNLKMFYLLFANNRNSKDAANLNMDSKHVTTLSSMLRTMYAEQLPLVQKPTELELCQKAQANDLVSFVLRSDARKLLSRKLESTKYLGHFTEDKDERKVETRNAQMALGVHIQRFALEDETRYYEPEGLRRLLNITDPKVSRRQVLLTAIQFLHLKEHPDPISLDQFTEFVSFCRKLLSVSILKAEEISDEFLHPNTALVLGKLQRRLSRIVTYESGAKAVTGSLFAYFRGVLNNGPLTLTPIIIPKVLQDERFGGWWTHNSTSASVLGSLQKKSQEIAAAISKGKSKGPSPLRQTPKTIKLRPKNDWQMGRELSPKPMIHAELRLVIYSLLQNLDISRVIGISKLPCLSCFCYLGKLQNALRREMEKDVRWATSGCSWKPYAAWAIPTFVRESILAVKRPDGIDITKDFLAGVASETQEELYKLAVFASTARVTRRASGSDSSAREISDDEKEVGSGQGESVPSGSLQS